MATVVIIGSALAGGTLARYVDAAGRLLGFALSGADTAHKNRLVKELQAA